MNLNNLISMYVCYHKGKRAIGIGVVLYHPKSDYRKYLYGAVTKSEIALETAVIWGLEALTKPCVVKMWRQSQFMFNNNPVQSEQHLQFNKQFSVLSEKHIIDFNVFDGHAKFKWIEAAYSLATMAESLAHDGAFGPLSMENPGCKCGMCKKYSQRNPLEDLSG